MRLDREERWILFFIVLAFALTAALVIIYEVSYNNSKHECEEHGGSYDSYNCRTMFIPMGYSRTVANHPG